MAGVILYPERHSAKALPPPPVAKGKGTGIAAAEQMSIPFTGAYFFFRGPGTPPLDAHVSFGDATDVSFRSTDGFRLAMEARQPLAEPVETRCCSRLELALRNADHRPGTVSVEVVLKKAGYSPFSLGSQPVLSSPLEHGPPASEILSYSLRGAKLEAFDTIQVIFHLLNPRLDRSAKVSIDRFILVRRG